jgi:hypothetical protein
MKTKFFEKNLKMFLVLEVTLFQTLSKNTISEKTNFDIYELTSEVFNLLSKTVDKIIDFEINFNK